MPIVRFITWVGTSYVRYCLLQTGTCPNLCRNPPVTQSTVVQLTQLASFSCQTLFGMRLPLLAGEQQRSPTLAWAYPHYKPPPHDGMR